MIKTALILLICLFFNNSFAQSVTSQPAVKLIKESSITSEQEPYLSKIFEISDGARINVNTINGNIEVVHNPNIDHVKVELYVRRGFALWSGNRNLDNYRILMIQRGNVITASVERRSSTGTVRSGDDMSFVFLVHTPKNITTDLRTLNGNILLSDLSGEHLIQNSVGNVIVRNSSGLFNIYSSGGSIELENIEGQVNGKTVVGNILINQSSGEMRFRSTTGSVQAEGYSGTLIASTVNGLIRATFRHVSQGVYMESVTGNIDLFLPQEIGYRIEAEGNRIDMTRLTGIPSAVSAVQRNTAKTTIGDGQVPIQLRTTTGTIIISNSINP
jgi:DUF4097 and DUF4098 domain-containing protein YvlB